MIRLILDVLMYRCTPFKSFFLFFNINDKGLVYNIILGLYMDFFVVHSKGIITIYLIIIYYLHKLIKWNYNQFIYYYLFNISGILFFFFLLGNYKYLLNALIVNSIYAFVSYKMRDNIIKLV